MESLDWNALTDGDDYNIPSPFQINFSPGPIPTTECVTITIVDDLQVEGDHGFDI